jgi:hypothetical protein
VEDNPEHAAIAGAGRTGWQWPALPWRVRSPLAFSDFAASWPFGLTARGVDFYKEREYLADLGQRAAASPSRRTSRCRTTRRKSSSW